jgi:hypothetical protein
MHINKLSKLLSVSIQSLVVLLLIQLLLVIGLVSINAMLNISVKGTIIVVGFLLVAYLSYRRIGLAFATLAVYANILHHRPWFFSVLGKITIASMLFTFGLDILVSIQLDMDAPIAYTTVKQSMWTTGKHVLMAYGILMLYAFRHLVPQSRKGGYYYIVQRLPAPKELSEEST